MNTLHLASLADRQRTLCGLLLSEVSIGGYCEYLDEPDDPEPVRMIFDPDGRKATACPTCLDRQLSALALTQAPLELRVLLSHPLRISAASGIEAHALTTGYSAQARHNSLALKPDGTARVSLNIVVTTNIQKMTPSPLKEPLVSLSMSAPIVGRPSPDRFPVVAPRRLMRRRHGRA